MELWVKIVLGFIAVMVMGWLVDHLEHDLEKRKKEREGL